MGDIGIEEKGREREGGGVLIGLIDNYPFPMLEFPASARQKTMLRSVDPSQGRLHTANHECPSSGSLAVGVHTARI